MRAVRPLATPVQVTFWTAEDVDLSRDPADWQGLETGERSFISSALGYLAASGVPAGRRGRRAAMPCPPHGMEGHTRVVALMPRHAQVACGMPPHGAACNPVLPTHSCAPPCPIPCAAALQTT